jgi:hypothetical protein
MEKAIALALAAAQRSGERQTVLNLNQIAGLYVARDYPGEETLAQACERNGKRFLVAVVSPDGTIDMRGGYTR